MAPRRGTDPSPHHHASHTGSAASRDRDRHEEAEKHHAVESPHPPHHPQKKPPLPRRHTPHTHPAEHDLNVDHGTHEDRPRPAKIAVKETKGGAAERRR